MPHPYSDWAMMGPRERRQWFDDHRGTIALAYAEWAKATLALARAIKDTGAAEHRNFSAVEFVDEMQYKAGGFLSEEVRAMLGIED